MLRSFLPVEAIFKLKYTLKGCSTQHNKYYRANAGLVKFAWRVFCIKLEDETRKRIKWFVPDFSSQDDDVFLGVQTENKQV